METLITIAFIIVIMVLPVAGIGYLIWAIIHNERNFKLFRSNLKTGDETREGKITHIGTEYMIVEKVIPINGIYPPENAKYKFGLYFFK